MAEPGAREQARAAIIAACTERGWSALRLAREAHITSGTAYGILRGQRVCRGTLAKAAAALGLEGVGAMPSDEPRDPSAIGRMCIPSEVDLGALRYVLRQLVDEARLTCPGRALIIEAGRLAGLPAGWQNEPLGRFGA